MGLSPLGRPQPWEFSFTISNVAGAAKSLPFEGLRGEYSGIVVERCDRDALITLKGAKQLRIKKGMSAIYWWGYPIDLVDASILPLDAQQGIIVSKPLFQGFFTNSRPERWDGLGYALSNAADDPTPQTTDESKELGYVRLPIPSTANLLIAGKGTDYPAHGVRWRFTTFGASNESRADITAGPIKATNALAANTARPLVAMSAVGGGFDMNVRRASAQLFTGAATNQFYITLARLLTAASGGVVVPTINSQGQDGIVWQSSGGSIECRRGATAMAYGTDFERLRTVLIDAGKFASSTDPRGIQLDLWNDNLPDSEQAFGAGDYPNGYGVGFAIMVETQTAFNLDSLCYLEVS